MSKNILESAEAYYTAMKEKNIAGLEKFLHAEVEFIAPLDKTKGKKAFLEATKGFMDLFDKITIRSTFSNEKNQAAIFYAIEFPSPIGEMLAAALLTFQDGLIKKIELFYDARPFG